LGNAGGQNDLSKSFRILAWRKLGSHAKQLPGTIRIFSREGFVSENVIGIGQGKSDIVIGYGDND
jgi:hypothetical protein